MDVIPKPIGSRLRIALRIKCPTLKTLDIAYLQNKQSPSGAGFFFDYTNNPGPVIAYQFMYCQKQIHYM